MQETSDRYVPMHQPRAEQRAARSRRRAVEGVHDAAELAQDMANAGLISQEAAQESKDIAERVSEKLGNTGLDPAERATGVLFAKDQLRTIIERIEHCEEEKKQIADDIRDIYAEAKGNGFDVKALRAIVRMRKEDPNERAEAETILETYMQALGML